MFAITLVHVFSNFPHLYLDDRDDSFYILKLNLTTFKRAGNHKLQVTCHYYTTMIHIFVLNIHFSQGILSCRGKRLMFAGEKVATMSNSNVDRRSILDDIVPYFMALIIGSLPCLYALQKKKVDFMGFCNFNSSF